MDMRPFAPAGACLLYARKFVNRSVRRDLAEIIEDGDDEDLYSPLRDLCNRYRDRVEAIARAEARHRMWRSPGPFLVSIPEWKRPSVEILHPIDDSVLRTIADILPLMMRDTNSNMIRLLPGLVANKIEAVSELLYGSDDSVVYAISPSVVVKISRNTDALDVSNSLFITNASPAVDVPVPRIMGAFRCAGRKWVFMARANGYVLESVWKDLNSRQKQSLRAQLVRIFNELGKLVVPDGAPLALGSFPDGICKDAPHRPRPGIGPVHTLGEFNDFLCSPSESGDVPGNRLLSHIRAALRYDYRLPFTHSQLHPRNIMVSWDTDDSDTQDSMPLESGADVNITAITGWDRAGFYPDYWEYVRAMAASKHFSPALDDWVDYLPTSVIGNYVAEYAIDCLLDECYE